MHFDRTAYGERIKRLRTGRELTQEQLAEKINVSRTYIVKIENGLQIGPIEIAIVLAMFFDVSMDYIFGRTDDPHGAAPVRKSVDEPELEQFIEMCFDPKSSANARLKETLKQMMREAKE